MKQKDCRINHFFLFFIFLSVAIIKKLLYETKKRKTKHNKLLYLDKNKLDCIEMLISQAITDKIIDHNEFKANDRQQMKTTNDKQQANDRQQIKVTAAGLEPTTS